MKHILVILCVLMMLISCNQKDINQEIDYTTVTPLVIGKVKKWVSAINSKDFEKALALTINADGTHFLNGKCSIEDFTNLKIELSPLTKHASSNIKDGIIILFGDLKVTINQNDDVKCFHKINISLVCFGNVFAESNWKIKSLELKK